MFSCRFWCQRCEEKLSETIASLLTSKYPTSSPNKRKRPLKSNSAMNSSPSADQVSKQTDAFLPSSLALNYSSVTLDFKPFGTLSKELSPRYWYRPLCTWCHAACPADGLHTQHWKHKGKIASIHGPRPFPLLILICDWPFQKQYSDLFALAAEDETTAVGRRGGSGRGRKQPNSKKDNASQNNSNKKNVDPVKTIYTSDDESSEVSWVLKGKIVALFH